MVRAFALILICLFVCLFFSFSDEQLRQYFPLPRLGIYLFDVMPLWGMKVNRAPLAGLEPWVLNRDHLSSGYNYLEVFHSTHQGVGGTFQAHIWVIWSTNCGKLCFIMIYMKYISLEPSVCFTWSESATDKCTQYSDNLVTSVSITYFPPWARRWRRWSVAQWRQIF